MKHTLLIGKFNEVTKQIKDGLAEYCGVQVCVDTEELAEGMFRLMKPNLVILSLVGSRTAHAELFALFNREAHNVPVVVIGSQENESELIEDNYLPDPRIRFLRRPVKLEAVLEMARGILDDVVEEKVEKKGPKTILVVDDDPTLLRTVQAMLSKKYRVTFATSASQALVHISRSKPDLILLDYEMPVVNGQMMLEMLRSEPDTKDIPVVFLTGMSESDHVRDLVALKPQGYILKPPSELKLMDTIEQVFLEMDQEARRAQARAQLLERSRHKQEEG